MRLTFLVSLLAVALLFVTLWKLELTAKNAPTQLRRLRRRLETTRPTAIARRQRAAARLMPALPLDEAGKYVAGAYGVFVALMLVYVAIMAREARARSSAS